MVFLALQCNVQLPMQPLSLSIESRGLSQVVCPAGIWKKVRPALLSLWLRLLVGGGVGWRSSCGLSNFQPSPSCREDWLPVPGSAGKYQDREETGSTGLSYVGQTGSQPAGLKGG